MHSVPEDLFFNFVNPNSWGHNGYCQLGNGSTNQGLIPCQLSAGISGCRISQIACGSHHTLVLTDRGEVSTVGDIMAIASLVMDQPIKG